MFAAGSSIELLYGAEEPARRQSTGKRIGFDEGAEDFSRLVAQIR